MDQQEYKSLMMEYLSGNLNTEKTEDFERYVQSHPELKPELEGLRHTWLSFAQEPVPNPSKQMDDTFYAFLQAQTAEQKAQVPSIWQKINTYFSELEIRISAKQLAFGLVIFILGAFFGSRMSLQPVLETDQLVQSSLDETEDIRAQLVMLLIDQPSASKRLQAVNEARKLQEVTEHIIHALLKTLNKDPNANVRLASVDALKNYIHLPQVREGLILSISHQDSPIVQIALADLMVALQESKSIESMKELLKQPEIDQTVKQRIQESILKI